MADRDYERDGPDCRVTKVKACPVLDAPGNWTYSFLPTAIPIKVRDMIYKYFINSREGDDLFYHIIEDGDMIVIKYNKHHPKRGTNLLIIRYAPKYNDFTLDFCKQKDNTYTVKYTATNVKIYEMGEVLYRVTKLLYNGVNT